MSLPSGATVTVEDLYGLPDDGYRYELQAGRLLSEPLPGFEHGRLAARIASLLEAFVRTHRLGAVLSRDAGYVLGRSPDTVRGPDVSFVARERLVVLKDKTRAFPGPPDLAVEVVSPSQTAGDVHAKVADYLAAGTRLVWVVEPVADRVVVYRCLLAPRVLGGEEVLDGEDVVPGFTVAVAEIFHR